jgi:hypothetical protein
MKKHGQIWPDILLKVGKMAVIIDWPDQGSLLNINYKTKSSRSTYFSVLVIARKLFGPFYWLKEYHAEVLKDAKNF